MMLCIDWPFNEAMAANQRDFQTGCFGGRIVGCVNTFDADQPEVLASLGQFRSRHGFETPTHDGLANASLQRLGMGGRIHHGKRSGDCGGAGQQLTTIE